MTCTFRVQFISALDHALIRKSAELLPQETTLVAPSNWEADEVADAFENQYPGSTVLHCTPSP
jgi:hypothetical protein